MSKSTLTLRTLASLVFLSLIAAQALGLTTPFRNLDEIFRQNGFAAISGSSSGSNSGRTVKVAILDNGFRNVSSEIGRSLPASTQYHPGPVAVDANTEESHGLFMAQLVSGLLDKVPGVRYELHLFSAFGYSNLEQAVETVISDDFDVVLYAQVWEYGGNSDGRGFINTLVNRATDAGVLWINAAGNFGDSTYRAPIRSTSDFSGLVWAELPGTNKSVRVRCLDEAPSGKCQLRAVLSWNDFKDDVKRGTDKDLDLVLTDENLNEIREGGLRQVTSSADGQPGLSLYPREIVEAEVDPGVYYLRVRIESRNFDESSDTLRIVTSGDFTKLEDATTGETLLAPADNRGVITIGASDSEKSSASERNGKPEIHTSSAVVLDNGEEYKGTSNSAAIAATMAVILKGQDSGLGRDELLSQLRSNLGGDLQQPPNVDPWDPTDPSDDPWDPSSPTGQLYLRDLQFESTTYGCFQQVRLSNVPPYATPFLQNGGVLVATTMGFKIFTPMDPFTWIAGTGRGSFDDMLVATQYTYAVYPRSYQPYLSPDAIEIVQMPADAQL